MHLNSFPVKFRLQEELSIAYLLQGVIRGMAAVCQHGPVEENDDGKDTKSKGILT